MTILVFDSGTGGLTVAGEIRRLLPHDRMVYVADTARFPYGNLEPEELVQGVTALMATLIPHYNPSVVVIACYTAATLVLPPLRARFSVPIVGTVPAIKPAAALSRTRRVSVLATPGTVSRDYTRDLIAAHGQDCTFDLVGSSRLAAMAEDELDGRPASDAGILAEIAPAFAGEGDARTDVIVLACTHYPWLLPRFRAVAPWDVAWIDPAEAIARRVAAVKELRPASGPDIFIATGRCRMRQPDGLLHQCRKNPPQRFDTIPFPVYRPASCDRASALSGFLSRTREFPARCGW